ncbi:MAG TPA: NADPH-dependent FMN reductase [Kofleriaceae bacterium]|nr:NADPH-dependent FMN reductase [Kofleriaceae bacterium]
MLALPGSIRRGSYNRLLAAAAVELAPPDMTVQVHADLSSIPLFSEDLEREDLPVSVLRLRDDVASASGLLIATPEYNQSIPGVLKNAIDWLSRTDVLVGKPVAIIGATTGRWGTRLAQAALRQVLHATGSMVLPGPALFAAEAESLFDSAGRLIDPATRATLAAIMAGFTPQA